MQLTNILSLALLGSAVASAYELKLRDGADVVELNSRRTHRCQTLQTPIAPETVLFNSRASREMITIYSSGDCEKDTRVHRQCFSDFTQKFESPGELARSYKVMYAIPFSILPLLAVGLTQDSWGFGCGSNDK